MRLRANLLWFDFRSAAASPGGALAYALLNSLLRLPAESSTAERRNSRESEHDLRRYPRQGNTVKDPEESKTGDEPMTGAQRWYLKTLSDEAHEPMAEGLTKAQAAKRIDELRRRRGAARSLQQARIPSLIIHRTIR